MVDPAIAEDLEILGQMRALRAGIIEGIDHADALDRGLRRTVDRARLGQTSGFEDRRGDVDHVMPLRAQLALRLDMPGPADDQRVAGAAIAPAICLVQVKGVSPATAQPAA